MERATVQYAKVQGPGERLDEDWGDCTWYEEIDERLYTVRRLEVYENGNILTYDEDHPSDGYGGLGGLQYEWLAAEDPNEELGEDYAYQKITQEEFEEAWALHTPINR